MSFEVRIEAARHDVANDGHPPNGSIEFKVRLHVEAALRACRGLDLDARRHAGTGLLRYLGRILRTSTSGIATGMGSSASDYFAPFHFVSVRPRIRRSTTLARQLRIVRRDVPLVFLENLRRRRRTRIAHSSVWRVPPNRQSDRESALAADTTTPSFGGYCAEWPLPLARHRSASSESRRSSPLL